MESGDRVRSRGVRCEVCWSERQSVDSWDQESPVTSLSVLLTHPALPSLHSYAPDTSLASCNTFTLHTILHTNTAVNCPADQVRWETNHLPHIETHEEMAKKLFNMSCRVTRETLPANSNIIDRRRFESLHLLIIFFSRNTWQFVLLGDLNEQNMFLKYHGKSYLLLCCDLLLPILQHRHVDIIC